MLDALSTDEAAGDADLVGALLSFEPRVEPDLLAERSGLTLERTKAALVQLGTSGRVGFDAAGPRSSTGSCPTTRRGWRPQPRLRSARKLVEGVRSGSRARKPPSW